MNLNADNRFMSELRAAMEADLTGTAGAPSLVDGLPSGTMDPYQTSAQNDPPAPGAAGNPTDLGGESAEPERSPYEGDIFSGNAGGPGDEGDPASEGFKEWNANRKVNAKIVNTITWADVYITEGLQEDGKDVYLNCLSVDKHKRKEALAMWKSGAIPMYQFDASKASDPQAAVARFKAMAPHATQRMKESYEYDASKVLKCTVSVQMTDDTHGVVSAHPVAEPEQPASKAQESAFSVVSDFFKKFKGQKGVPMNMDEMLEQGMKALATAEGTVHGPSGKRMVERARVIAEDKAGYAGDGDLYNLVSVGDVWFGQIRADYQDIDTHKTVVLIVPTEAKGTGMVGNTGCDGYTVQRLSSFVTGANQEGATGENIGTAAHESFGAHFETALTNMGGNSIIQRDIDPEVDGTNGDKLKNEANDPVQPDAAGDDASTNPPKNGQAPQSIGSQREPDTGDTHSGNAGDPSSASGSPVSKSGAPTGAAPSSYAATANDPSGNPPSPGVDVTPNPSLDSFIGACQRVMIDRADGTIEIPSGMTMESYALEIGMAELTARALESDMTAAERRALKDSDFGLPEVRKWPLNDEAHVRLAIKYFWRCGKDDQKELAKNILKAMRKFGITEVTVSANNPFKNYYPKATVASGRRDGAKSSGK